jgi:hypothetical protein
MMVGIVMSVVIVMIVVFLMPVLVGTAGHSFA